MLTQSLRSSVYEYKEENGRRYHAFKEGAYFMPNDDDGKLVSISEMMTRAAARRVWASH